MIKYRRTFIKSIFSLGVAGLAISSGILYTTLAKAQSLKEHFKRGSYQNTLNYLFKDVDFIESHKIKITRLPRVAENGAMVPITVNSSIKNVEKISILVEKNPSPLSAEFYLSPAVKPHVSARLKMAKTCDVIVIIQANGKFYRTSQSVKVTVGGCG